MRQKETRRKLRVSKFKARHEDAFAEYQDDLAAANFKEMKYENGKLEQEKQELQEATIHGDESGNSALSNRFRKLENIQKNCSYHLKSKEVEWSSQLFDALDNTNSDERKK